MIKLIINKEYRELVPPLSIKAYEDLKESIRTYGQYHPISVNKGLEILDGFSRNDVCQDLGREPIYAVKEFPIKLHEKLFVIDSNLQRRQLTAYSRGELALKTKPILEEIARNNSNANLRQNNNGNGNDLSSGKYLPLGRVNDQIAKRAKTSRDTIRKIEYIKQNATEEVKQRLREDKTSISKVYSKMIKRERIQQAKIIALLSSPELTKGNPNVDLKLGDMWDKGKEIADNSIDLIFTDPPYNEESVPLYGDLAKLAQRVLKPGGSLITFIRQAALPEIIDLIRNNSNLQYHWLLAVKHNGNTSKMWNERVWPKFKPLLWYFKPKENGNEKGPTMYSDIADYIESEPPSKELHEWEQSAAEVEHVVKVLTVENQIILDPFMGSGITGIAALNLNRKFIGIEIDKEWFEIARANIHNTDIEAQTGNGQK